MLDTIVRYLHDSLIPFKLSSYPSMEHLPRAAQPVPHYAILVETQLVLIAEKPAILCFAAGDTVDLATLANELSAPVVDTTDEDVPEALRHFDAPPPPLGQLFGFPLILDEKAARYGSIVFQPFGESDYVEVPYDDFARQEQPKVVSFTRAGELPRAEHDAGAVSNPAR